MRRLAWRAVAAAAIATIAALHLLLYALNWPSRRAHAPRSSARCLLAMRSSLSSHHILVLNVDERSRDPSSSVERMLAFQASAKCPSWMYLPQTWQSRATVTTCGPSLPDGPRCAHVAPGWFPTDYVGLFVVVLAMLPPALLHGGAPRLLILGNGGGVLAQLIARVLPSAIVDAVEPDEAVIRLGTLYFGSAAKCEVGWTSRACVHHADGRAFVRRRPADAPLYDLVFLDAFAWFEEQETADASDAMVPPAWRARKWCSELRRVLRPSTGVLAANLWEADEGTRSMRRRCDARFGGGSRLVLDAGPGQTVEAWSMRGSDAARSRASLARAARGLDLPPGVVDLGAMAERAWRSSAALPAREP